MDFLRSLHFDVRIDTKIESIASIMPEISKVIPKNVYDLEFEGQTLEMRKLF